MRANENPGLCDSKHYILLKKNGICKMCHTWGNLHGSTYNNPLKLVKRENYKKKQEMEPFQYHENDMKYIEPYQKNFVAWNDGLVIWAATEHSSVF